MSKVTNSMRGRSAQSPDVLVTVVLGLMLGYVLSGDLFMAPMQSIIVSCSMGILWALIFLQWVTMISEGLAIQKFALPEDLNLADRDAVKEFVSGINDYRLLPSRMSQILTAWGTRWDIQQVVSLVSYQSQTCRTPGRSATVFGILLALPGIWFQGGTLIAWSGVVALGITLYARQALYATVEDRVQDVLIRLPSSLPGVDSSAAELAGALEKAVEKTLSSRMPDADAMAKAIGGAVEQASSAATSQVESLNKAITENQQKLLEKLEQSSGKAAEQFKAAELALTAAAAAAGAGLGSGGDQVAEALKAHAAQIGEVSGMMGKSINDAIGRQTEQLDQNNAAVAQQLGQNNSALSEVLDAHAAKLNESTKALTAQLDKIAGLEKEIGNVLHLQESVDGTLKSVAASEDFRETLSTLRTHLQASDKLLQEAVKPRTIRLVESDPQA